MNTKTKSWKKARGTGLLNWSMRRKERREIYDAVKHAGLDYKIARDLFRQRMTSSKNLMGYLRGEKRGGDHSYIWYRTLTHVGLPTLALLSSPYLGAKSIVLANKIANSDISPATGVLIMMFATLTATVYSSIMGCLNMMTDNKAVKREIILGESAALNRHLTQPETCPLPQNRYVQKNPLEAVLERYAS